MVKENGRDSPENCGRVLLSWVTKNVHVIKYTNLAFCGIFSIHKEANDTYYEFLDFISWDNRLFHFIMHIQRR